MRFPAVPALFLACLTLAGCASSSGPESVLAPRPSGETTSSVVRPSAPVPATAVGPAAARPATTPAEPQEALAWAGPSPDAGAFAQMEREAGMPVPMERPVAFIAPENPAIGAVPRTRSHVYSHRFRDAKPINFGKRSPHSLAVHGVDVSRWQGEIDWQKLRTQGANFAYIKATDGGDHLDPMFKKNWRRAQAAGLKRGAYHFFYWCRTAGEQADWFIRNVPREADALPPVIDVEWNGESSCKRRPSPARVREKMQVFMDKLERHYGQRPIIYTAPDFYRDNLENAFPSHPFWLRSVAAHPSKVYPGRKWLFWQYSGSGLSHGVDGRIDLNVFHGSEEEWQNFVAARSI
ncbi:glycoside hydrolase family 25 protein [Ensifer sp. NBAIM29]|nr:glycoside hydrolase family 25 protein [Ensifer sp. NBAIM29]